MADRDIFHADAVRRLYDVTRRVNSSADLAEVLQEIANGVVEGLGYGVAAISRLEGDTLVTQACGGPDEVRQQIVGRRTPADRVLNREFSMADHWGILRYVPHDRMPPEQIQALWIPDIEPGGRPDDWHPLDALYAPLYSSSGELLGNLSVDLPPGNKIPQGQARELLEMFAVQAGLALDHAQRRERLSRQVRIGEALRHLATLNVRTELEATLGQAVESLAGALDMAQVTTRCFPDSADDPVSHAAGFPADARDASDLVDATRLDLSELAVQGRRSAVEVVVGTEPPLELPHAGRLVQEHLTRLGLTRCLMAAVGTGKTPLGYLAAMRSEDQPLFDDADHEAVRQAGRELGRIVREARLRRTEQRLLVELREVDRYKGELIATISHELKTPLTSIIGHTELLEDAGVAPSSVAAISRNAARLDRLITNLLTFSRMESHRELDLEPVDLVELCRASVEMLRVQADANGVEIELEAPDGPIRLLGDPEELPRAIDNLCSNAVKYTPAGGRVCVTASADDTTATVVVRDTGIGISVQDQAHLFSAFYRSSNPEALTLPGTGLGLAIARSIAEAHGGDIAMDSELGRGSTFTLRLPLPAGDD
ncbi:MAG TPA: ATP-binding protein [Nocardioides sp.]|nr:ATP-binding protein [Nocardioides sp.]